MTATVDGIEKTCLDCQERFVPLKSWRKRCPPCYIKYKLGPGRQLDELRTENARLRAEVSRLYGEVTAAHEAAFRARCAMTKSGGPQL